MTGRRSVRWYALWVCALWGCAEGGVLGGPGDDAAARDEGGASDADDVVTEADATSELPAAPDATDLPDRAAPDVTDERGLTDTPAADRTVGDGTVPVDRVIPDVADVSLDRAVVDVVAPDVAVDVCAGTLCAGRCVDTTSDAQNCGGCGRACTSLPHVRTGTLRCLASTCTFAAGDCEPGYADCDGMAGNGCEADLSRAATCGGCSVACAEPTPSCVLRGAAWVCDTGCAAGLTRCAGACVATSTDVSHCGACGNRCPTPPGGVASCEGGRCGGVCTAGSHVCGAACVSNLSPATCGTSCSPCPTVANGSATCDGTRCALTCNAGYLLLGGACVRAFCGAGVVPCAGGVGCPPNSVCTSGGGCLCAPGYQAVTCAGVPCTACPGADFYCAPVFCGGGGVLCRDGGYCPVNSTCSPDSTACLCNPGRRAVTCAGTPCTPCAYPSWRCL